MAYDKLMVRHWGGWLSSPHMQQNTGEWLAVWLQSVKEAEANNCELHVFKIPLDEEWLKKGMRMTNSSAVTDIEKFLQEHYPLPS